MKKLAYCILSIGILLLTCVSTSYAEEPMFVVTPVVTAGYICQVIFSLFALGILICIPIYFLFLRKRNIKKCSKCAEWIKKEATVCKHCGNQLQKGFSLATDSIH